MIYIVPSYDGGNVTYVCPDQATIDAGIAKGYVGNFVIGTETTANELLNAVKAEYLPTIQDRFSVNKDIDPDPVQTTWVACNLNTEPPNTDVDYNIFNAKGGFYTLVTGLENAKSLSVATQKDYVDWALPLESFQIWPPFRDPRPTISSGTQTL